MLFADCQFHFHFSFLPVSAPQDCELRNGEKYRLKCTLLSVLFLGEMTLKRLGIAPGRLLDAEQVSLCLTYILRIYTHMI